MKCPACGSLITKPRPKPAIALKRLRLERGLTMRELAMLAGLDSHQPVFRMEHGGDIMLSNAVALAAALGVPLAELVG